MSEDTPEERPDQERHGSKTDITLAEATAQWTLIAAGSPDYLPEDLERLIRFVSERGFTPFVAGLHKNQAEFHYEKHVIRYGEWPLGTSLDDYIAAGRDAVLYADRIFTHRFRGVWQVGFWSEIEGERPILVQYRLEPGRWTTVFRPLVTLEVLLSGPEFEEILWIR